MLGPPCEKKYTGVRVMFVLVVYGLVTLVIGGFRDLKRLKNARVDGP